MDKTVIETDVLVIGGGIAGLQAGVEACHRGQKATICKLRNSPVQIQ
jgi:succinate dehydrogenase/fumarate reductase flavoprotein subunit